MIEWQNTVKMKLPDVPGINNERAIMPNKGYSAAWREKYSLQPADAVPPVCTTTPCTKEESTAWNQKHGGQLSDSLTVTYTATVADVVATMVGALTPMKMQILLSAVNDCSPRVYTGIKDAGGVLHGEEGNVIGWEALQEMPVNIGNINIK